MRRALVPLLVLLPLVLGGCAGVKPWERDVLAQEEMAFDPDPLEAARRNHVYYSKEASLPGGGAGGGGCGCN
ncbi:MAG: DUF4266 domain-containing protein [Myxococcota bacterium]